jgi:hypothetical protein
LPWGFGSGVNANYSVAIFVLNQAQAMLTNYMIQGMAAKKGRFDERWALIFPFLRYYRNYD